MLRGEWAHTLSRVLFVMVKQRKNGGKPRNGVPWWRKLVLPRRGVKDSRLRPAADTPEQIAKLEK